MEKDLKVREVIDLCQELNIFLMENFNQAKKYHIELYLQEKIIPFVKPTEIIKKELVAKYGDGISIRETLEDGSVNPSIKKFWDEYNPVLDQIITVDCSCKEIDLSLLESINSDRRYKSICLHIIKK